MGIKYQRIKNIPKTVKQNESGKRTKAYDRVSLTLYKGGKDIFSEHAKKHGESLNSFIQRAMRQTTVQDGGDVAAWDALAPDRAED